VEICLAVDKCLWLSEKTNDEVEGEEVEEEVIKILQGIYPWIKAI
jgi:hypothetical protein